MDNAEADKIGHKTWDEDKQNKLEAPRSLYSSPGYNNNISQ
jgi:hypothetical protein